MIVAALPIPIFSVYIENGATTSRIRTEKSYSKKISLSAAEFECLEAVRCKKNVERSTFIAAAIKDFIAAGAKSFIPNRYLHVERQESRCFTLRMPVSVWREVSRLLDRRSRSHFVREALAFTKHIETPTEESTDTHHRRGYKKAPWRGVEKCVNMSPATFVDLRTIAIEQSITRNEVIHNALVMYMDDGMPSREVDPHEEKVPMNINLARETWSRVDELCHGSRSEFVRRAVYWYLDQRKATT